MRRLNGDARRALLVAALGFLQLERRNIVGYGTALHGRRGLAALHAWLDSWTGIGHIVVGMERLGSRVSIKKWETAWGASFQSDVMLSAAGHGSGPTPWRAAQLAAWDAVKRAP